MKDYRQRKDKLAVVVVGQASESESDDEDDEMIGNSVQRQDSIEPNLDQQQPQEIIDSRLVSCNSGTNDNNNDDALCNELSKTTKDNCLVVDGSRYSDHQRRYSLQRHNQQADKLQVSENDPANSVDRNKDSLLHNLLKESNCNLKKNLINLSCTPYLTYNKDIGRLTRYMIATQKQLQTGCGLLQKTASDLNQLDQSFITLSNLMSNNKLK